MERGSLSRSLELLEDNAFKLLFISWGGFCVARALWSIGDYRWSELLAVSLAIGVVGGTVAAATMVPGAIVHWACLTVAARRTSNRRMMRIDAVLLSPLLAIGTYLAFRGVTANDVALLIIAFGVAGIYGLRVRLPAPRRAAEGGRATPS